jgi:hypothetical protein
MLLFSQHETIQHFFFDCPIARLMWYGISVTFDVKIPESIDDLFGPWLTSFVHKQMKLVLLGVAVFCWALWLSENDVAFQRPKPSSFLQVGVLDQKLVHAI